MAKDVEKTYTPGELKELWQLPSATPITQAFYRGRLDGARCLVIVGRRRIPESYLPEVRAYLAQLGLVR